MQGIGRRVKVYEIEKREKQYIYIYPLSLHRLMIIFADALLNITLHIILAIA